MEASATQRPPKTQPDAATLGALVVILMSGLPAAQMAPMAEALLAPFGISAAATSAAIGLVWPHLEHDVATATEQPVSALAHTLRTQPAREAAYVVNAAKRLMATGDLHAERRYIGQHLAAERGRRDAARAVDAAAKRYGPELGWYSVRDERSTAGCRAMHGRNFNAAVPPVVEGQPAYPGAVHVHCRCRPGAPHRARVREPARVPAGAVSLAFDPTEPRDSHGRWMRVGSAIKDLFTPRSRFAKDALDTATEAIGEVHAMPTTVPHMDVRPDDGRLEGAVAGVVRSVEDPGTPIEILLAGGTGQAGAYTDDFSMVHEIGHLVDLTAFRDEHNPESGEGVNRFYASYGGPTEELVNAAQDTAAIQRIREVLANADPSETRLIKLCNYLLSPHEIFARAYAQWITIRSREEKLQNALDTARRDGGPEQWSDAEFTTLAEVLDRIFSERRWLR